MKMMNLATLKSKFLSLLLIVTLNVPNALMFGYVPEAVAEDQIIILSAPELSTQAKCKIVKSVCVDGPSTKNINGVNVTKACWQYENQYNCLDPNAADFCEPLKKEKCEVTNQNCLEKSDEGECLRYTHSYSCDVDLIKSRGALPPNVEELPPTHLIIAEWDMTTCDAATANAKGKCTVVSEECLEGPATKEINGVDVYRDCWKKQVSTQCLTDTVVNECEELVNKGCTIESESCLSHLVDGTCQITERKYRCETEETTEVVSQCADKDFGKAMTGLEVAREMGKYYDITSQRFFQGEDSFCSIKLGGALDGVFGGNCCKATGDPGDSLDWVVGAGSSAAISYGVSSLGSLYTFEVLSTSAPQFIQTGISNLSSMTGGLVTPTPKLSFYGFSAAFNGGTIQVTFDPASFALAIAIMALQQWLACKQPDIITNLRNKAGLCHKVGSFCSDDSPLGCITKKESYCCYISKLAKIIAVEGKKQLNWDWGNPESPSCEGFLAQDIERLDFSKMDLSEFYEEIKAFMPKAEDLTNKVKNSSYKNQTSTNGANYYDQ